MYFNNQKMFQNIPNVPNISSNPTLNLYSLQQNNPFIQQPQPQLPQQQIHQIQQIQPPQQLHQIPQIQQHIQHIQQMNQIRQIHHIRQPQIQMHQMQQQRFPQLQPIINPNSTIMQQVRQTQVNQFQKVEEKRKLFLQELIKYWSQINSHSTNPLSNTQLVEKAKQCETTCYEKANSFVEYEKNITDFILKLKTRNLTTKHTTPPFPATLVANKINNNSTLIQNNTTAEAAALAKTINNVSPSINTAKLVSVTSSLQQSIPQIPQPVSLNNTTPQKQAQVLKQPQITAKTQAQVAAQTPVRTAAQASIANTDITSEEMKRKIKLKNFNEMLEELRQYVSNDKVIKSFQNQYEEGNEKNKEDIERKLYVFITQLKMRRAKANQTQIKTPVQVANNMSPQASQVLKPTSLNNTTTIKTEPNKTEPPNKTPMNQPKSLNNETIKIENKASLKTTNSDMVVSEDNKPEIEKNLNKTSSSTSTKKRNNRKSNNTPSPLVSSVNLSKKGANASKDFKLEKDKSFLGKIDRNINIFLLESKNFKSHVKSNSKIRNIVQNSFKYIIEPNRPAYGINSCAEEISSLFFNKNENKNKRKNKPFRLENINESPNDHISLFEDIINRKSHIVNSDNKNANKKNLQQKINFENNENEISNKRKFDEMNDNNNDAIANNNKRINTKDKYSNIIEEITFLKDKYKINVNILDPSYLTLIFKDNKDKNCEISWNDFITMINTIKKEESENINNNNENDITNTLNTNDITNNNNDNNIIYNSNKINDERVLLVISLNLSNYIDLNEGENDYNIPGDNQSNIILYARIPKSTQRYSHQGIFDWSLSYTKKKSIFQNSEEDNKLKEKKIYEFVKHKIHDQDTNNTNDNSINTTTDKIITENDKISSSSTKVIKVWHIVEWILEGIKN